MSDTASLPPAAEHFLQQLELEAAALPASDRHELLMQIREHLGDSIDDGAPVDEVLARLGSPRELVLEAGGDAAPAAAPALAPWHPGPLLWIALAGVAVGVLLLLWSGTGFALVGRGRMLLPAATGLLLTVAAAVVLVRGLRTRGAPEAEAVAKRRFVRGVAIGCIALGAMGLLMAGGLTMLTGRFRAVLLALPALVLALGGVAALVRAGRERQPASP